MVSRTSKPLGRRLGPLVLAVAMAITVAACDTPPGTDGPTPVTTSSTATSPAPPEPTPSEPTPTPTPTATPTEPAPERAATAQAVCDAVYRGRGAAPHAESGDLDDEMALYELWHVGLLDAALAELGSSADLDDLVTAMEETRALSARAALIYAEHPTFSAELGTIQNRQTALADEVGPIAVEAGAPSCATLVVLP